MAERALEIANHSVSNNSISLIENVNLGQVTAVMQKINQFQSVVKKTLKEGHDYGVIAGTSKPTLLKPGAEKILMLMGVTSEYELIERIQDYDKGFFAYTVRCILSRNGQVITEGLGHCNTREKKYVSDKHDPYTLANTCLKMAKKRAQIDAVLTIASLSEVFTQDVEDLEDQPPQPQRNGQSKANGKSNGGGMTGHSTENQQNAIRKIANQKGLNEIELDALIKGQFGCGISELSKQDASNAIKLLQDMSTDDLKEMAKSYLDQPTSEEEINIPDDELPF